jgi:hypothetical protein
MNDMTQAKHQAEAQLESIRDMVCRLRTEDHDDAYEEIQSDPLCIEVRSGWAPVGQAFEPEEFMILLCTGGPAVRIIGELDEHLEPIACALQFQDWFTPWVDYPLTAEEQDDVLTYCQQFYYGEG